MRKLTLLFILISSAWCSSVQAQCSTCTPAFITCPPAGGLCNHLDTAYANHMYDKQVNFYMPKILTDPAVLNLCSCNYVELRQIRVTGVSGLPTGINYTLSQNGQYNVQGGDSVGCAHFCGTPLVPGLYPVTVYLMADVTAHGTPIGDVTQNNNPQQYKDTLLVLPDTVSGVTTFTYGNNGSSACNSITVDLNAPTSAPQPNMTRYFWDFGNGQTSQQKTPGQITYTNSSLTKADTFPLTLTTVFYNYRVKKVHISNITDGYCGDVEEPACSCTFTPPDPYIKFVALSFDNNASYHSNQCTNNNFDNLNLVIQPGNQTIDLEIWDKDNGGLTGSQDDLLGTYTLNILLGQQSFSNNNADGYVEFDTVVGYTTTETLNVIVNPYPATPTVVASSDTFCSTDSVRISIDNVYDQATYEWYRDTVFLTSATDSFFYSNAGGNYKVKVTNQAGCQSESAWKTIVNMPAPPATINLRFNGTSVYINPFPSSGFAADWYFNGSVVPGQSGKFLAFLGNGEYRAELYNIAFPSCRVSSLVDTVVSGINEIKDNAISGISVFPNPSNGKFTLKFVSEEAQTIELNVENVMGQKFFNRQLNNFEGTFSEDISTAQWGAGVYILSLVTPKGRRYEKIIAK